MFYDRNTNKITTFVAADAGMHEIESHELDVEGAEDQVGIIGYQKLLEDIELLDGACEEFDQDKVSNGEISPVFFGSALTNFGVETFIEHFFKRQHHRFQDIAQSVKSAHLMIISLPLYLRFRQT